jgi:hypothetical protein
MSKFIVVYECEEAIATSGTVLTKEGDKALLCVEAEGWVPATSSTWTGKVEGMAKKFKTKINAAQFMEKYTGHPWYGIPRGPYEIFEVEPVYKQVLSHYQIKPDAGDSHE